MSASPAPWRGPRAGRARSRGGALPLAVAVVLPAVVLGWLTTQSFQLAASVALVALVAAAYAARREWGLVALFAMWFLSPALRRVLQLDSGYVNADPLAAAPFLATAAVVVLELGAAPLDRRPRRVLLLAGVGFGLGLPLAVLSPVAGLFATLAYLGAVGAIALGWREGSRLEESTLRRILLVGLPLVAIYAIAQRVLPLTPWDDAWLANVDLSSIGVPGGEEGVRVFGTLNAPGALAPLLGLGLLCSVSVTRHRGWGAAGAAVVAVALALTYVRASWLALAVAAVVHVVASGGRSARVIVPAVAGTVALTLALAPVNEEARKVVDRFSTFGELGEDRSASDRSETLGSVGPEALARPLGHGLGTAGEPSRIGDDQGFRVTDNGYLSLLYQAGPVGLALVLAALAAGLVAAWRGARARAPGRELRVLLLSLLVFLLVSLLGGDTFYGVSGVLLWFVVGHALAAERAARAPGGGPRTLR